MLASRTEETLSKISKIILAGIEMQRETAVPPKFGFKIIVEAVEE